MYRELTENIDFVNKNGTVNMTQDCNEGRTVDFMITDKTNNNKTLYPHMPAAWKRRIQRIEKGQGRSKVNKDVDVKVISKVTEAPRTPRNSKKESKDNWIETYTCCTGTLDSEPHKEKARDEEYKLLNNEHSETVTIIVISMIIIMIFIISVIIVNTVIVNIIIYVVIRVSIIKISKIYDDEYETNDNNNTRNDKGMDANSY